LCRNRKRFKLRFITLKDYGTLSPYDAIIYDKRNYFTLLFDMLIKDHTLFNLFFSYSIMEPLGIRILKFYLEMIIIFALSAFFFSDEYIDMRAELPETDRVNIFNKIRILQYLL